MGLSSMLSVTPPHGPIRRWDAAVRSSAAIIGCGIGSRPKRAAPLGYRPCRRLRRRRLRRPCRRRVRPAAATMPTHAATAAYAAATRARAAPPRRRGKPFRAGFRFRNGCLVGRDLAVMVRVDSANQRRKSARTRQADHAVDWRRPRQQASSAPARRAAERLARRADEQGRPHCFARRARPRHALVAAPARRRPAKALRRFRSTRSRRRARRAPASAAERTHSRTPAKPVRGMGRDCRDNMSRGRSFGASCLFGRRPVLRAGLASGAIARAFPGLGNESFGLSRGGYSRVQREGERRHPPQKQNGSRCRHRPPLSRVELPRR